MKKFKLSLSILLSILLIIFTFGNSATLQAKDQFITEAGGGGRYYVEERLTTNNLPYGVKQFTDFGYSSTDVATSLVEEEGVYSLSANTFYSQQVNVLEVPNTTGVKLVNYADFSNHIWNRVTVKNMALDYESKNPGWKVVGAINGDYFDINSNRNLGLQVDGPVISDGNYYKTTSRQTIGFKNNGSEDSFIVSNTAQRSQYMKLDVYDEYGQVIKTFDIENLNKTPSDNQTSIYFATYNKEHNIVPVAVNSNGANAYFVTEAELALPNNENDFYGNGVISSTNDQTISIGQFAIVTNNEELTNYLKIGVKIRAQYVFAGEFADVYSVMGFRGTFLKDGAFIDANDNTNLEARHPRTVIGVKENGTIIMAVVDGRQRTQGYHGAVGDELAAIMKRYGAIEGYNLDGGGSSTMLIRQGDDFVVTNSPSDGGERRDSNCLLIVAKDPDISYEANNITTTEATFTININDDGNHDIQKLFVQLGSDVQEVVNNQVTFSKLRFNNSYDLLFSYEDINGNIINMKDKISFSTLKRPFTFNKLNITETDTQFIITPDFRDLDEVTNIPTSEIIINDEVFYFVDGILTVDKSQVGDKIIKIVYNFNYDYNLGQTSVSILNAHYYSTMTLNIIIDNNNSGILDLYK